MSQVEVFYQGNLSTKCEHPQTKAQIITHPIKEAFSPTDLIAISLGSCVLTVMGMAADRLGVDFSRAKALVSKEMSKTPPRKISELTIHCIIPRSYSEEVQLQLKEAALGCPVHHSLHPDIKISFSFEWGAYL